MITASNEPQRRGARTYLVPEPLCDGGVVCGGVLESLPGQPRPHLRVRAAPLLQAAEQLLIVGRVHHHSHLAPCMSLSVLQGDTPSTVWGLPTNLKVIDLLRTMLLKRLH